MKTGRKRLLAGLAIGAMCAGSSALAADQVLTGAAAFGDWRKDAPGVWRHIKADDIPPADPNSPRNNAQIAPMPEGALPKVPAGFEVKAFAKLEGPRLIRTAPNGDFFVTESLKGQISVLRAKPGAKTAETTAVYATGLDRPFGLAFYPAKNPKWLYVTTTNKVVRYPYVAGDLTPRGEPEVVIDQLTEGTGGHWTRDLDFTADGKRMIIAVGSQSNFGANIDAKTPEEIKAWEAQHGVGASWGYEAGRAEVRSYTPEGKDMQVYATGVRNCSGLIIHPATQDVWCSTNERDLLGDNLVPDYVSRIKKGGFYGWPWFYLGANPDTRKEPRPDLANKVIVPDVLIQSHSAALQTIFYPTAPKGAAAFPAEWRGQAFTALHGSWNRAQRTGYKVVRLKMKNGVPTGEYQDFLTGFVLDDRNVWGRPVGVTVAPDGALLVTEDANGMVWRIAPTGK